MKPRRAHPWWVVWVGVVCGLYAAPSGGQDVWQANLVWLPDASGFVFSKPAPAPGRFSIMQYDVSKRALRVVVLEAEATSQWLALSPDGTQIAALRLGAKGKEGSLELLFYDWTGQARRSAAFPWGTPGSFDLFLGLFWGAVPEKLIVSGASADLDHPTKTPMLTGIYHLPANTLTLVGHVVALPIGGTPLRPDGHGFLATRDRRELRATHWLGRLVRPLVFIDWDGWQYLIETPDFPLGAVGVNYVMAYWDGPVAVASWPNTTLRIDTDARRGALITNTTPHVSYTFPNGRTLRLLEEQAKRLKPADTRRGTEGNVPLVEEVTDIFRLELHPPLAHQPPGLIKTVQRGCWLYPAPNQHLVALGRGAQILVIDDAGTLVAHVSR